MQAVLVGSIQEEVENGLPGGHRAGPQGTEDLPPYGGYECRGPQGHAGGGYPRGVSRSLAPGQEVDL